MYPLIPSAAGGGTGRGGDAGSTASNSLIGQTARQPAIQPVGGMKNVKRRALVRSQTHSHACLLGKGRGKRGMGGEQARE